MQTTSLSSESPFIEQGINISYVGELDYNVDRVSFGQESLIGSTGTGKIYRRLKSTAKYLMDRERPDTHMERVVNSITGFLGFVHVIPLGVLSVFLANSVRDFICIVAYTCSLLLLYGSSTAFHTFRYNRHPRLYKLFSLCDHCAIYTLITGSYIPMIFLFGGIFDRMPIWSIVVISILGLLTVVGIVCMVRTIYFKKRDLSILLYLGMGWVSAVFAWDILTEMLLWPRVGLVAGGIFFTTGAVFVFPINRFFFHGLWHCFVLGGTLCMQVSICFHQMQYRFNLWM